jgi:hypothetical protein
MAARISTRTRRTGTAVQTPPSTTSSQQFLFFEIGERSRCGMPGNVVTAEKSTRWYSLKSFSY